MTPGDQPHIVDIQVQALRHPHVHVVLQHKDLLKITAEDPADSEDEQNSDGGTYALNGDMPHPLPPVGAVQLGCFVQPRVNPGYCRYVDNGAPAGSLSVSVKKVIHQKYLGSLLNRISRSWSPIAIIS
jgi:hypothetical protein